jgi:hypothetical protein
LQLFKLKYGDNIEVSLDMSIPYIFIKMFLEDKGYDDLVAVFVKAGFTKDNEEIELKTIIKILTGKINSINEVYKGSEEEKEEILRDEDISERIKTPVINTSEKIGPVKEQENTYSDTSTKEDFPVVQNISDEFEETGQLREKHLRFHFKDEEIKTLAKKVFRGNKYLLLDSLLEMEKLRSWREATEYLKEIFINNKVNIGDKSVIMFVDVLNDYFEKR